MSDSESSLPLHLYLCLGFCCLSQYSSCVLIWWGSNLADCREMFKLLLRCCAVFFWLLPWSHILMHPWWKKVQHCFNAISERESYPVNTAENSLQWMWYHFQQRRILDGDSEQNHWPCLMCHQDTDDGLEVRQCWISGAQSGSRVSYLMCQTVIWSSHRMHISLRQTVLPGKLLIWLTQPK